MNQPLYFKEKLTIGNLDSPVGICTLWTPKEKILKQINRQSFCFGGQLYSARGINFIVRNLLAKPAVRYLVVCGCDLSDSGKSLVDFFAGKDLAEGVVDVEIPREALEELRKSVSLIDLSGEEEAQKVVKVVAGLKPLPPVLEPQVFPEPELKSGGRFPTDPSVFKVRGDFIGEVWLRALKHILKFGFEMERIGGHKVLALHNLVAVIEKENAESPKIFPYFNFNQAAAADYIQHFFDKELANHSYTYGARLQNYRGINQIRVMQEKLKRFAADEGALAVLWDAQKDNFPPKDDHAKLLGKRESWNVPCLNLIQAQCFGEKLSLTAYFRAHDIYNAWPRNLFALRELQQRLAKSVSYELGSLTAISEFAWVARSDLAQAEKLVDKYYKPHCEWDPRGNFIIEVKGSEIVATHLSPRSKVLQEFRIDGRKPKAAVKFCGEIIGELAISDLNHAADLGRELAKAETAIKLGLKYTQDHPLSRL